MKIICPLHGIFEQTPNNHLKGQGCPQCAHRSTKYDIREIIEKLKAIYGNAIDYEKDITYSGNKKNMTLYCVKHGYFTKNARLILQGHGCPECSTSKRRESKISNKDAFIAKAKTIHNDKYIYDKTEYVHSREKVIITCPIHGDFTQTPNSHLNGSGCPKCASENRSHNQRITEEEVIRRFNEKHSGKYLYDSLEYDNIHDFIDVICPIHGKYTQMLKLHMMGHGCPKCNQSHSEKEIERILTENNIKYIYQYKRIEFGRKSIDFYLPDFNIAIECQGIQHFKPINFGGNMNPIKNYDYTINNDIIKHNICEQIGIKLLYFLYNVKNIDKNIILKDFNRRNLYNEHNLIDSTEKLLSKIKERII